MFRMGWLIGIPELKLTTLNHLCEIFFLQFFFSAVQQRSELLGGQEFIRAQSAKQLFRQLGR